MTHALELSQEVGVKLGSELKRHVSWESHSTHVHTHMHTPCTHNEHACTHTHTPCIHTNLTICRVELEFSFLWHFFLSPLPTVLRFLNAVTPFCHFPVQSEKRQEKNIHNDFTFPFFHHPVCQKGHTLSRSHAPATQRAANLRL